MKNITVLFGCKEALLSQQEDVLNNSRVTHDKNAEPLQDGENHPQSLYGGGSPGLYVVGAGIRTSNTEVWLSLQLCCTNLALAMKNLVVFLNYENVLDLYKIKVLWGRLIFN